MKKFILSFAILYSISNIMLSGQDIRITEEKVNFLTYDFSDPDPISKPGKIYPYFRYDGYSNSGKDKEWNIISIENPYIKVLISPEIGGKIMGAFEKSTGNTFIYFNNVIKFRDIAQRGAWVSGGIEYNFGSIGHTPASATPVDYVYKKNSDGSYSCFLGGIDLSSRTEWRVEINVPADKAYFETIARWYNPTNQNTSLYHWMNASTDVGIDMSYEYPGQYYIDHGGKPFPWTINPEGIDISKYANNNFGADKSYHIIGNYTDFFGTYYSDRNFGSGHWSLYPEKQGKKIWMWSQSRKGAIWVDLLTDTKKGNIQYTEIQTGILFNQANPNSTSTPFKHLDFKPGTYEQFHELWFPFMNTGGMTEASRYGVVNMTIKNDSLYYYICAIANISGELKIKSGDVVIFNENLNMKPMESHSGIIGIDSSKGYCIDVANGLIYYNSEDEIKKILDRPVEINREFDWNTVFGMYTKASENAKQRNYEQALEEYEKSLEIDPMYSPSLVGAGRIYFRKMDYEKARQYYLKAMANDTYDPDANFYYALTCVKLGDYYNALDAFGTASRSMKYRSSAYLGLAEVYFIKGRYSDAEYYANLSLDYNVNQINALKILSIISRINGSSETENYLNRILSIDPLNHFANFEKYFNSNKESDLEFAKSMIRNELPIETYIELALYYYKLGLIDETILVFKNSPEQSIVFYWLSYLLGKKGDNNSDKYLNMANEMSPDLVFPFREETADVLEWAKNKQRHWKTSYYLALINWSKGNLANTKRLFTACGNQPDYAPFYLSRGNLYSLDYPDVAKRNYELALDLDTNNWRTYHLLFESYSSLFDYDKALSTTETAASIFPDNYIIEFDFVKALLYKKEFAKCIKILNKINILPNEGARSGHDIYRQIYVLNALENLSKSKFNNSLKLVEKAREWPENLGVGKPYKVDERVEDFVMGYSLLMLGNRSKSTEIFNSIINNSETDYKSFNSLSYLHAMAYRLIGQKDKGNIIIENWKKTLPGNKIAQWAEYIFSGDKENADKVLVGKTLKTTGTPWNPTGGDNDFKVVYEIAKFIENNK